MDQILLDGCDDLLALDYETTGLDPFVDKVVGVGIADSSHPAGVYFNLLDAKDSDIEYLYQKLAVRRKIAHNVTFEMGFGLGSKGYSYCTKGLVHQIESDWSALRPNSSLKPLQVSMLQWEYQGDVKLDEWLIDNGYFTIKKGEKVANKGDMWHAPVEILGHYCCLDAQSTLMLYNNILRPILDRFPELDLYHSRDFMNLCERVVEQRVKGLYVDKEQVEEEISRLEQQNVVWMDKFFDDSIATPIIEEYQDDIIEAHLAKENSKIKKDGTKGKLWPAWNSQLEELRVGRNFNPNSKDLLAWLFYDRLFVTRSGEETDWRGNICRYLDVETPTGEVRVERTAKGRGKMDQEVMPLLGDAGTYLAAYNKNNTILAYMRTMLGSLDENGYHHTQLRVNGTVTDRCAGTGGVNIQQLVKHKEYLSSLKPAEGNVYVQMDVDALEPVVIAELSQCEQYMKLYGPDAPRNDVYLFVAASMAAFSDEVRKYYDPDAPTPESISECKKKCSVTRKINKEFHLEAVYGAGVNLIHSKFLLKGIDIEKRVVADMRRDYWRKFKDVKTYEAKLKSIRIANNGFMLGGLGCPISVSEKGTKDILNRMIQNTGHKILVKWLYHFQQLRDESGLDVWPVVIDFHDETVWECADKDAAAVRELMRKTWDLCNNELGGIIKLTGEPEIFQSFAEFKCEG